MGLGRRSYVELKSSTSRATEALWEQLHAVKTVRRVRLDYILHYLVDDPYAIGTGYAKEMAWRRLRSIALSRLETEFLRCVALSYVKKRFSREFFSMCQFFANSDDATLRSQLRKTLGQTDCKQRTRAEILDAYVISRLLGDCRRRLSLIDREIWEADALPKPPSVDSGYWSVNRQARREDELREWNRLCEKLNQHDLRRAI